MTISSENVLKLKREFSFGNGGSTLFPVRAYEPLKNLFDVFNKSDSHVVTLRQK